MASAVINTRADLDAIEGTPEHAAFMVMLAGTLYRLEKDDTAATWRAIEDDSTVARFGFTRADFPDVQPPELPAYVPEVEPPIIVSRRQIKQALTRANLRAQVEAAVAAGDQDLKDWWNEANQFEENHPTVIGMSQSLGVSGADLHDLFVLAKSL